MYIYNLGHKFKLVATENPNATALITEAGKVTYKELDEQSDALAVFLMSTGITSADMVCISGHKQLQTIVCMLGALKAGIAYSVFDPESPILRLGKIFERCMPKLILCDSSILLELKAAGFEAIDYATIKTVTSNTIENSHIIDAQLKLITANSPAYIMFTSGSTGFPKGAVMTQQNVLNLINWSLETYGFNREEVLTSVNPLYFDNSVFDLYSSLFSGATLALFDSQTVREPGKLMRLIDEYKCTSWFSVPSMLIYLKAMRAFRSESLKHVKRIIFGGEGYPKAKLKELFDMFSHRMNFYNVYGPTECTCICSSYLVTEDDFSDLKGFLPLGNLAPNFDALIVDEEMSAVKPGELGELILRGANVGLGYYRDPERTEVSFIQNPTNNAFREIVYRTGDIVFLNEADGKIWIIGRADNQIKHMGYRIELEEIENALSCIESVAQGAAIHCEIRGLSQIVAFVKGKDSSINEEELRDSLKEMIPHYMIPTRFQFLQHLPKNANGKLDRKQLKTDYLEQLVNG